MIDFNHWFFLRPLTTAFPYPLEWVTTEAISERIKKVESNLQRPSQPLSFLVILPVLINLTLHCGLGHLDIHIDSRCTGYDEYRVTSIVRVAVYRPFTRVTEQRVMFPLGISSPLKRIVCHSP